MATLKAMRRDVQNRPKALRQRGLVPAVVYGAHTTPVHITVTQDDLWRLFDGITRSTAVELDVEGGEEYHVFLKDIQVDPVSDRLMHVDFYVPEQGRALTLAVPIRLVGNSPGVKEGGMLETLHEYIYVHARARHMPPYIEVDISKLDMGESLLVSDLDWGEGVEPLLAHDSAVVTVISPRGLAAAATAAAAEDLEGLELVGEELPEEDEEAEPTA